MKITYPKIVLLYFYVSRLFIIIILIFQLLFLLPSLITTTFVRRWQISSIFCTYFLWIVTTITNKFLQLSVPKMTIFSDTLKSADNWLMLYIEVQNKITSKFLRSLILGHALIKKSWISVIYHKTKQAKHQNVHFEMYRWFSLLIGMLLFESFTILSFVTFSHIWSSFSVFEYWKLWISKEEIKTNHFLCFSCLYKPTSSSARISIVLALAKALKSRSTSKPRSAFASAGA